MWQSECNRLRQIVIDAKEFGEGNYDENLTAYKIFRDTPFDPTIFDEKYKQSFPQTITPAHLRDVSTAVDLSHEKDTSESDGDSDELHLFSITHAQTHTHTSTHFLTNTHIHTSLVLSICPMITVCLFETSWAMY